jgi:carbon starvation protein
VVALPLAFVTVVTVTASLQKIFSTVPQVGYFANHVAFRDALAAGETSFGTATSVAAMEAVVRNTMIQGILSVTFLVLSVIVITISIIKVIQAVRPGPVIDQEDPEVPSHRFAPAGLIASSEERAVEKQWNALPSSAQPTRGH